MLVIRLKSGFEMHVECEDFTIKTNSITGALTNVHVEGCRNIRPIFFNLNDVDAVYETLLGVEGSE